MATKKKTQKDALVEELTAALADLKKELADLKESKGTTKTKKTSKKGEPRENVSYDVKSCFMGNQPPQCMLLSMWAFVAAQKLGRPITEPELAEAFEAHADEWNYGQSMWHVWGYYRPRMIGANHVVQI